MSVQANPISVSEPIYYHREYENDIGKPAEDNSWLGTCQRVGTATLPFLSLHKPLSSPLSLAMGGLRTWTCLTHFVASLEKGNTNEIGYALLQTAIAITALAGTIFAHPIGMLITTGHDLIIELSQLVQNLYAGEHRKVLENCLSIANNALYLVLFLDGGLEFAIASLAIQILVGLYHSFSELQKGNYLEGTGHVLMAMIRGNQLAGQVKVLRLRFELEETMQKMDAQNASKTSPISPSTDKGETRSTKLSCIQNNAQKVANQELIDILIKYGNNPEGIPALHYAVVQGDEHAVKLLLDHGASPNALSRERSRGDYREMLTPLDYAAKHGRVNIMQLLVDRGASINLILKGDDRSYQLCPALSFAAQYDQPDAIKFLVSKGAIIEPQIEASFSPLYLATTNGSVRALNSLVEAGANVRSWRYPGNQSLLHFAAQANQPDSIRFLVNHGLAVDLATEQGQTALHYTMQANRIEAMKALIELDANIDAMDKNGLTPLLYAMHLNHSDFNKFDGVKLLLENGASPNVKDSYGHTPFRRAINGMAYFDQYYDGYKALAQLLFDYGADINDRRDGHTILADFKNASSKRHLEIRDWLIAHGARE